LDECNLAVTWTQATFERATIKYVSVVSRSVFKEAKPAVSLRQLQDVDLMDERFRFFVNGNQPKNLFRWQTARLHGPLRTLVVVLGNLRGGEETWRSLLGNLIDVNHAHLALMLGSQSRTSAQHSSLLDRAEYVWEHAEYGQDWSALFDELIGPHWRSVANNNIGTGLFAPRPKDTTGTGLVEFGLKELARRKIKELNLTTL
jgi:hypothetical protein